MTVEGYLRVQFADRHILGKQSTHSNIHMGDKQPPCKCITTGTFTAERGWSYHQNNRYSALMLCPNVHRLIMNQYRTLASAPKEMTDEDWAEDAAFLLSVRGGGFETGTLCCMVMCPQSAFPQDINNVLDEVVADRLARSTEAKVY